MLKKLLAKFPSPEPRVYTEREPTVNDILDLAVEHQEEVQFCGRFIYGLVYLADRAGISRRTVIAALNQGWDQFDSGRTIEDEDIAALRRTLRGR